MPKTKDDKPKDEPTKKAAPAKPKPPTEEELAAQAEAERTAAKEARGRSAESPFADRDPRLISKPEAPVDDEAKRAWKESRSHEPAAHTPDKHKDKVSAPPPPPRERTPEEIAAKEQRGLVRHEV